MPVVYMWCTHKPKLRKAVPTSAVTTSPCASSAVPAMAGTIIETMPAAGRKMT